MTNFQGFEEFHSFSTPLHHKYLLCFQELFFDEQMDTELLRENLDLFIYLFLSQNYFGFIGKKKKKKKTYF